MPSRDPDAPPHAGRYGHMRAGAFRGLGLGGFHPVLGCDPPSPWYKSICTRAKSIRTQRWSLAPGLYWRTSPWYNLNCTEGWGGFTPPLTPQGPFQSVRGLRRQARPVTRPFGELCMVRQQHSSGRVLWHQGRGKAEILARSYSVGELKAECTEAQRLATDLKAGCTQA